MIQRHKRVHHKKAGNLRKGVTANSIIKISNSNDCTKKVAIKDTAEKVVSDYPITNLPFGPKSLVTHKFPKHWDSPADLEDKHIGPHQKEIYKINDYFMHFDRAQSIRVPLIRHITYVPIGDDSLIIKDNRKFESDFKCRLPDFGSYQCFYWSGPAEVISKDEKIYHGLGSLVLYNPENEEAEVLNIYNWYEYGGDGVGISQRYFFIGADKKIIIFEHENSESDADMYKSQEIKVLDDGKLSIKNFKTN